MTRRAPGFLVMGAVLATAACCSKSEVKGGGSPGSNGIPVAPAKPTFTMFALAEVRGQIGPCGCTTDPLGDIARTAKLVADARTAGPTVFVDAGSLLYSKSSIPPHLATQEELKAQLLAEIYRKQLAVAAIGIGPADHVEGAKGVAVARQAANATGTSPVLPLEPPKVIDIGGAKVGVFGVVADDIAMTKALSWQPPVPAGKQAVSELRRKGARVVVALIQASTKKDAVRLARDIGGIDLAIAGLGINAPEPERVDHEPQKIGDGWLVIPANRGQVLSRIDVTLRGDGPLADAIGDAAAAVKLAALDKQLAALDADLARFAADKDADPAFVKQKQAERTQLAADREQLRKQPLVIPAKGSYFTLAQLRINKPLACATDVQDAVTAFYKAAGEANVKAAANTPVKAPAKGKAGYVGGATCDDCHGDAVEFWKKTRHAGAWNTLVQRGQQFDFDCIGCHVTGWDQPGGANLAHNEPLRDVQCEVCHGPASIHLAKGGEEKPPSVWRNPPENMCATQCHTKEHSDTFQLEAYLRDVLGPGHGEALRKQLGDGPTGAQLRKAGLDKAGKLGPGCIR